MSLEEELRNALQDEGRALGSPGSDLATVQGRGRRRKAWKAAGMAFATVLVVGAGTLGITTLAGGGADDPVAATSTAAPTTTVPTTPTTTVAPSTTLPVSTTEPSAVTTTIPAAEGPPVLVAVATTESEAPNGLVTIDATGEPTPVFAGRFARLASDGLGGMVFQAQVATEDANRDRGSIYRVPAGTTEPVEIVEQEPGHIIQLRTVALVAGQPEIIYTDSFGYESPETARIVMMGYDLASQKTRQIAVVGGWESGISSISYGKGVFVLDAGAESERSWKYLDEKGQPLAARFDPMGVGCESGDIRCPMAPTMAPDGRLVYARSVFFDSDGNELDLSAGEYVIATDEVIVVFDGGEQELIEDWIERVEIVIVDLATGADKLLVSLFQERSEGEDGGAFFDLDFDGRYLIVSDRKGVPTPPAFVVDTEQPEFRWGLDVGGVASFPLAPFDLPGVVQSPIG